MMFPRIYDKSPLLAIETVLNFMFGIKLGYYADTTFKTNFDAFYEGDDLPVSIDPFRGNMRNKLRIYESHNRGSQNAARQSNGIRGRVPAARHTSVMMLED